MGEVCSSPPSDTLCISPVQSVVVPPVVALNWTRVLRLRVCELGFWGVLEGCTCRVAVHRPYSAFALFRELGLVEGCRGANGVANAGCVVGVSGLWFGAGACLSGDGVAAVLPPEKSVVAGQAAFRYSFTSPSHRVVRSTATFAGGASDGLSIGDPSSVRNEQRVASGRSRSCRGHDTRRPRMAASGLLSTHASLSGHHRFGK